MKIKIFLCTKMTLSRVKRPKEWEKTFANCVSDKGLLSKIYEELLQLNMKKKKQHD